MSAARHPARRGRVVRWAAVLVGVAVLVAAPTLVGRLPVASSATSAQTLLAAINRSAAVPYSGYAEAVGGLALPEAQQLSSLTDLFGGTTRMRTWWQGETSWRVDTVAPTGERDLYRDAAGTWSWDFEANTAVRSTELPVRLPRAADLVPAALGRRLLSEADPTEVHRLDSQRIAGRDAPGLQLRPDDPRSTITAVDVWADPTSGIPLRVLVHSAGEDRPVIATSFLDFSTGTTAPEGVTSFTPPPGARVRAEAPDDFVAQAQRLTRARVPEQLAGFPRRDVDGVATTRAVGTYGRGVTTLATVALSGRTAGDLRTQLSTAPTARVDATGVALTVGPLNLRLTDPIGRAPAWLLAGTVTPDTLTAAAGQLRTARAYR